jgi:NADH dehydrogenase
MQARIYQPPRSAMTSGQGNTKTWVLEYVPEEPKRIDPLMGWTGSGDMRGQVRIRFASKDAAVDYAERNGIPYRIEEPHKRRANVRPRGYGGNFAHDRRGAWTH